MLALPGYGLLATPIVSVRPSRTGGLGWNVMPCHVWNRTVASASSLPPVLSLRWIFCKSLPWLILSTLTHAVTKIVNVRRSEVFLMGILFVGRGVSALVVSGPNV